jgi:hypothetical protein
VSQHQRHRPASREQAEGLQMRPAALALRHAEQPVAPGAPGLDQRGQRQERAENAVIGQQQFLRRAELLEGDAGGVAPGAEIPPDIAALEPQHRVGADRIPVAGRRGGVGDEHDVEALLAPQGHLPPHHRRDPPVGGPVEIQAQAPAATWARPASCRCTTAFSGRIASSRPVAASSTPTCTARRAKRSGERAAKPCRRRGRAGGSGLRSERR